MKFLSKSKNWSALWYFLVFEVIYWITKYHWNTAMSSLEVSSEMMELLEIVGIAVSNVNALSLFMFIYIIGRVGK